MKKLKAKIAALKESAKNKVLDAIIKRIALKPEDVASGPFTRFCSQARKSTPPE